MPQLPRLADVLSVADAKAALEQQQAALACAAELYRHWAARRKQMPAHGPLLQELWFEMPWKVRGPQRSAARGAAHGGPRAKQQCRTVSGCVASQLTSGMHVAQKAEVEVAVCARAPRGAHHRHVSCVAGTQAVCYESQEEGEEGMQGDMPFSVAETKNSRGGWCRLRLSNEDAYDILLSARQEMEVSHAMR